jgi:hypothetical protein
MPGFVPGIDVLVVRHIAVGSIAERHWLTTAYHPLVDSDRISNFNSAPPSKRGA